MNFEETLVQTALAGTQKPHAFAVGEDSALGALCDQITQENTAPSLKMLRLAAALAVSARCGFMPTLLPVVARAPVSAQRSAPFSPVVTEVLEEGPFRLQVEMLVYLAADGLRLPSQSLITALTMGRTNTEIRVKLLPVLGVRGRWLASQNKAWAFAAGSAEPNGAAADPWGQGMLSERLDWLRAERLRDPVAARELLAAALGELPPAERAALVAALDISLGQDDEAILNLCLKDRAQEVRSAAARLLAKLPESAFSERMDARLGALLMPVGDGWLLDAPEAKDADASWKSDQIEATKPSHNRLGERAWLLAQLVARVHPSWWTSRLRMAPIDLLRWAEGTRWKDALHQGWLDAVSQHPSVDWSTALLEQVDGAQRQAYQPRLMQGCGVAQVEALWKKLPDQPKALSQAMQQIVAACPAGQALSPAFSARLLERLTSLITAKNFGQRIQDMPLIEAGTVLDLAALQTLCSLTSEHIYVASCLQLLQPILARRLALAHYFASIPSPR